MLPLSTTVIFEDKFLQHELYLIIILIIFQQIFHFGIRNYDLNLEKKKFFFFNKCGLGINLVRGKNGRTIWMYAMELFEGVLPSPTCGVSLINACSTCSTDPHCVLPLYRLAVSQIAIDIRRTTTYKLFIFTIFRRERHVTSIKFILTAILLGNLSFMPRFYSHWSVAQLARCPWTNHEQTRSSIPWDPLHRGRVHRVFEKKKLQRATSLANCDTKHSRLTYGR